MINFAYMLSRKINLIYNSFYSAGNLLSYLHSLFFKEIFFKIMRK